MNLNILVWTDKEIAILEEFYPTASFAEVEKLLPNRKKSAIIAKASKLKIKRIVNIWTKEELSLLKKHYPGPTTNDELLALFPTHSFVAIKTKAKVLGVKRGNYIPSSKEYTVRRWTKDEIDVLRLYYHSIEDKDLLNLLPGRTLMGMKHIVRKLKMGNKEFKFHGGNPWTNTEDSFLIENFCRLPNEELMDFLDSRTLVAIKARAQKLGLKRDKNIWASVGPYRPWKQPDIDILSTNWNNVSLEKLSELIGHVTPQGLRKQAKKMGLPPYDKIKFAKPKK